ncbi:MAG: L-seryl-tRNA(Sec) selenium transferase [Planctomycetes bacterium]|nr:L-seryl-tRNA(Sec) selenium transferase [Planctomycetota bacterium]
MSSRGAQGSGALRALPKVDELLDIASAQGSLTRVPRPVLKAAVRDVVEGLRAWIRTEEPTEEEAAARMRADVLVRAVEAAAARRRAHSLEPVVNATGVVLHTGLGRAPLAPAAAEAARCAAQACALEIERGSGERGQRDRVVGELLCELTGAQAATACNNNAAATLLAVNTFALGKEVIVSRGELVEIGGSYRMPAVIERGGAKLVEVGTTNRTRIADYRAAVSERTGLLMKVHTSNYRIGGFTEEATLEELAALGRELKIPVVHDLGSGLLRRSLVPYLADEPTVEESVAADPDLTLFSGDKLLGGPQAGICVGHRSAVEAVRKNPMFRAMRLDKLILAALEATLRLHLEGDAERTVPAIERLRLPIDVLRERAQGLREAVERVLSEARTRGGSWMSDLQVSLMEATSEAGSGSAPTIPIPTCCVALSHATVGAGEISRRLRLATPPVFTRVKDGSTLLDPRTLGEGDVERVAAALSSLNG